MRKQNIQLLVFAIAVAVVALVSVQLYWVSNAIALKQEEFARNVNDALADVVETLEKQEALERLRSHQQGKFLFFDSDSIQRQSKELPDSGYAFYQYTEVKKDSSQVKIKVVNSSKDEQVSKEVIREVKEGDTLDIAGLTKENFNIENTLVYKKTPKENQAKVDSIVRERVMHKTAFVGDIVKSLIQVNLNEKIEDRLKAKKLDSLLAAKFEKRDITTQFNFAVFDKNDSLRFANNDKFAGIADFQTRLFPNDVLQEPHVLKVYFPNKQSYLLKNMWLVLLTSVLLIGAVSGIFYYSILAIIKQKKVSEIKNDFINNMTHELKTPISTISLACEALSDEDIAKNGQTVQRYVGMITDENKRLGVLVENVLRSAVLEKGDFNLKKENVDVHRLIGDVIDKAEIQVSERKGKIDVQLNAEQSVLEADPIHLTNVLYNLLDNANKYSPEAPEILIATKNTPNGVSISVSDKGIGINAENQKKVFDKLYRVPTGNIHDVKGFGLGLSYVKIIIEKHGGEVTVKSKPEEGSKFIIHIPFNNETTNS